MKTSKLVMTLTLRRTKRSKNIVTGSYSQCQLKFNRGLFERHFEGIDVLV